MTDTDRGTCVLILEGPRKDQIAWVVSYAKANHFVDWDPTGGFEAQDRVYLYLCTTKEYCIVPMCHIRTLKTSDDVPAGNLEVWIGEFENERTIEGVLDEHTDTDFEKHLKFFISCLPDTFVTVKEALEQVVIGRHTGNVHLESLRTDLEHTHRRLREIQDLATKLFALAYNTPPEQEASK